MGHQQADMPRGRIKKKLIGEKWANKSKYNQDILIVRTYNIVNMKKLKYS